MRMVPLSAIADIAMGSAPPSTAYNETGDGIPMIAGAGDFRETYPQPKKWTTETTRLALPGDLIICVRATIGDLNWADRDYCLGRGVAGIRAKPGDVDIRYVARAIGARKQELSKLGTGSTFLAIRRADLENFEIPVPETLYEQQRIAAILDKADALRHQRRESIRLIESLLQTVFIDMFVRNPEAANWIPHRVEWMAKKGKGSIRTGPFGSQLLHSEFVDHGIAVIGIDNAVRNRFEWGQPRFITPEKYRGLKRYKVFAGDLIITIMGTLGRCAIVPDDIPEAINTKHLCCISLDHEKCLPEFLHAAFLNHPELLRQLGVRTKGAVMPGLNMGIIKELELPMPPVELQKEFTRIATLCTSSRADLEGSQDATGELFGSIQQRAFKSELDLSRLNISAGERSTVALATEVRKPEGRVYHRPGSFIAPPEIEMEVLALEDKFDQVTAEPRPWSENYFKYRTLSQALVAPFSFAQIWEATLLDMEEASYETVKDKVFEYITEGILEQRFDDMRREIVFIPRP